MTGQSRDIGKGKIPVFRLFVCGVYAAEFAKFTRPFLKQINMIPKKGIAITFR